MKEKVVDINRVYWYSLPIIVFGSPVAILIYQVCHGTGYKEVLYNNPSLLMFFVLSLIEMIVLHELIHGLFFALYAKNGFKRVKFGVMWKYLAPYCHCEEAIKAKQYGIVLLMPTILLGAIPFIVGFIISNMFIYFLGLMMIFGGIGDMIAFGLIKKVSAHTQVIDHSSKVGFFYE